MADSSSPGGFPHGDSCAHRSSLRRTGKQFSKGLKVRYADRYCKRNGAPLTLVCIVVSVTSRASQ